MAITLASNSTGVIPLFSSVLDSIIERGYEIRQTLVKITAMPYEKREDKDGEIKLRCYHRIECERKEEFFNGFDERSYLRGLHAYLNEIAIDLRQMGEFAELKAEMSIKGTRALEGGLTQIWDKTIKVSVEGYVTAPVFNRQLLSTKAPQATIADKEEEQTRIGLVEMGL